MLGLRLHPRGCAYGPGGEVRAYGFSLPQRPFYFLTLGLSCITILASSVRALLLVHLCNVSDKTPCPEPAPPLKPATVFLDTEDGIGVFAMCNAKSVGAASQARIGRMGRGF